MIAFDFLKKSFINEEIMVVFTKFENFYNDNARMLKRKNKAITVDGIIEIIQGKIYTYMKDIRIFFGNKHNIEFVISDSGDYCTNDEL